MKIKVDENVVLELSETQIKCIQNDIPTTIFSQDMSRRVSYVMKQKYWNCLKRLKNEWIPKLKESGLSSIPLDDDEFCNLVFSQPDYKDREARDLEGVES